MYQEILNIHVYMQLEDSNYLLIITVCNMVRKGLITDKRENNFKKVCPSFLLYSMQWRQLSVMILFYRIIRNQIYVPIHVYHRTPVNDYTLMNLPYYHSKAFEHLSMENLITLWTSGNFNTKVQWLVSWLLCSLHC